MPDNPYIVIPKTLFMNCLIVDDDELSRNVLEDLVNDTEFLTLVKSCESSVEAYNILQNGDIDLVFLDIEMPKMSGMELLENLTHLPQVVLVTSHEEYAAESYQYDVTDYIVKPVSQARFLKAVNRAKERIDGGAQNSTGASTIFVRADSRLVQLNTTDILYVEALGNYVNIYTPKERFTVHITMKEVLNKLPDSEFTRVHRSFIVRLDKIEAIEDNFITIGSKSISIGRAYREELSKHLNLM